MMRFSAAILLVVATTARSAPHVESVRIGLPALAGALETRSRPGFWTPVHITLNSGPEGFAAGAYRIAVHSTDAEDVPYRTIVSLPGMAAGENHRVTQAYAVPGAEGVRFRVALETSNGEIIQTLADLQSDPGLQGPITPNQMLILGLGAGLRSPEQMGEKVDAGESKEPEPSQKQRRFALVASVADMPDQWIGYDAVDVVVLATATEEFLAQLIDDRAAPQRMALLEWVRRGGQLVIAVGRNHKQASRLLEKIPFLELEIRAPARVKALTSFSAQWCPGTGPRVPLQNVNLAQIRPGSNTHVLVSEAGRPVLVQASCGLGRVVLVGFDLDSPPFTVWEGQVDFWRKLQSELLSTPQQQGANAPRSPGVDAKEIGGEIKRGLETFAQVPVVSFGWVALLLLFYIVLVGPLDYLILKKVFKRLELTWLTFPVTVVLASAAAYLTAYGLKGQELRINKIDVVEIDLQQPRQVYGRSWFSLFRPRAQSLTVGLTPAPTWAAEPSEDAPGPVLTMLETLDRGMRTGSQGLYPKAYEYAEKATGLRGVPVAQWATRSFAVSWRGPVQPNAPGIDPREIGDAGKVFALQKARPPGEGLVGRLTNRLPVELQQITLFYREKWYDLGTLAPGESRRVESLFGQGAKVKPHDLKQWFADPVLSPGDGVAPNGRRLKADLFAGQSSHGLIRPLFFLRASESFAWLNSGLRPFDQSWRLRVQPEVPIPINQRFRDEAILVARTPMLSNKADDVSNHGASPTRLWLGQLPADGSERPAIDGYLTQETYIRVYIPVVPAAR
jgi:hypothetical protein